MDRANAALISDNGLKCLNESGQASSRGHLVSKVGLLTAWQSLCPSNALAHSRILKCAANAMPPSCAL